VLTLRKVDTAAFATLLRSQPIGQKAVTRDLLVLLGHTRPDKIELEKGLRQWTEVSWFLDEAGVRDAETGADGQRGGTPYTAPLPKTWRPGSPPDPPPMPHHACPHGAA